MTPKSLLRHPAATSSLSELTDGRFYPVLAEGSGMVAAEQVKRLILCSGKVYYDLITADARAEVADLSIARVEELYPFPAGEIAALLQEYPLLEEVVWVQEEPRNMGALSYLGPRLRTAVPRQIRLRHVARPERASPAEGKNRNHRTSQERVIMEALGVDAEG